MSRFYFLYIAAFAGLVGAGNILSANLGSGTVPSFLKPLADHWTRAERDQKWIRLLMWILFAVCALTLVGSLVYLTYPSIVGLGQRWPQ